MEYRYPHLCSPITLGNTTFKSRIFSAPMGGTDITADCCIGPKSTKFYELRAKGGAAAVTVSECMVQLRTSENEIILDATGKKNGRGAYLCFSEECLEKAIKNHGLEIGRAHV